MYGSLGLLGPLELLGLLGIFNTEVTPDWINNGITRVEKRPEVFTHICSLQSKHSMHSAFDLEPDLTSVPESPKIEDMVQTKKTKITKHEKTTLGQFMRELEREGMYVCMYVYVYWNY